MIITMTVCLECACHLVEYLLLTNTGRALFHSPYSASRVVTRSLYNFSMRWEYCLIKRYTRVYIESCFVRAGASLVVHMSR
jgi:hypothetical protein